MKAYEVKYHHDMMNMERRYYRKWIKMAKKLEADPHLETSYKARVKYAQKCKTAMVRHVVKLTAHFYPNGLDY